jgi:hypothetical protein
VHTPAGSPASTTRAGRSSAWSSWSAPTGSPSPRS